MPVWIGPASQMPVVLAGPFGICSRGRNVGMIRKSLVIAALFGLICFVPGCGTDPVKDAKDKLKDAKDKLKDAEAKTKDAADKTKEAAADAAKKAFAGPIEALYPEIEKKIKALAADPKKEATALFDKLKELLDELKKASPEKWEALKDKVTEALNTLKKKIGLDKKEE